VIHTWLESYPKKGLPLKAIKWQTEPLQDGDVHHPLRKRSGHGRLARQFSLEARVFEPASAPGETLMATFPTDEQIEKQSEDLCDSIENGTLVFKGEEIDILEMSRLSTTNLQEYHLRQMGKTQHARALLAFKRGSKAVVSKAKLVRLTKNYI
jgi:hypothetical protein